MKKFIWLIVGTLILFSCEREEFNAFDESSKSGVQTRATSSIADFYPIPELAGIPVNIINVGNKSYKYLSADATKEVVSLSKSDDGSLRQRWYIETGKLRLVGGHIPSSNYLYIMAKQNGDYPIIVDYPLGNSMFVNGFWDLGDNTYNIFITSPSSQSLSLGYMYARNESSSEVKYKSVAPSVNTAHWQIVPVGEFDIVKMEYEKSVTYNDYIEQQDMYVNGAVIGDLPYEVQHTFNITKSISSKSSFSKAEGTNIQSQRSYGFSLGIGDASKVHIGFNGEISNTVTSSETLTWGEETTETMSISQTFTVPIPPHTPCRIEVLWRTFRVAITYVATLEKVDGIAAGKRFRIKGKWKGVVASDLYYNIYSTVDDKLIGTKMISRSSK